MMMERVYCLNLACLAYCLVSQIPAARAGDNWPSFRNGGTSVVATEHLPVRWSADEGIAWRAEIPGYGQSSPVVYDGKVFVTSSDGPFQGKCFVHTFDLAGGRQLWSREVPTKTAIADASYSFGQGNNSIV